MNSNTSYPWHRAVQDAVDENNENQVETKIQLAEFAIFERIDLFSRKDYGEEEEALFDALVTVRVLKIRRVGRLSRDGYGGRTAQ
jgi:hypothetical protein